MRGGGADEEASSPAPPQTMRLFGQAPANLPPELAKAAEQQKLTSWYECQAAQGAIFGHKCAGLRDVAQAVREYKGTSDAEPDTLNRMKAIFKNFIAGVEGDEFYQTSLKRKSLGDNSEE
jgi:hypothetical protein